MKVRLVGAELSHELGWAGGRTDGLTDMTKLIVFRNFANAPKTWSASVTRQACGETLQLASYRDLV
jgi:hypothetical protein